MGSGAESTSPLILHLSGSAQRLPVCGSVAGILSVGPWLGCADWEFLLSVFPSCLRLSLWWVLIRDGQLSERVAPEVPSTTTPRNPRSSLIAVVVNQNMANYLDLGPMYS